ncbi:hypothetical protein PGT21_003894 [Puccinia graminis f. sp. tritici]|uniref:Uncharacterized protein n=1 Tax=Puccinia graminis f. sp. tritici TaxID=56615 RepID=A0A5B0N1M1_PUCGR|nr:hypothetical protein PGT21_003894 [Puccinia graminis f. sp. tritici]KAA1133652.1 hypothetical protein PGTUg99_029747 [Puccinia graminis f. sp. tritici]
MPLKKSKAPPSTPCPSESTPSSTQAKKKKAPVPWDKDGKSGMTSIRILLEWLAMDGAINHSISCCSFRATSGEPPLTPSVFQQTSQVQVRMRRGK